MLAAHWINVYIYIKLYTCIWYVADFAFECVYYCFTIVQKNVHSSSELFVSFINYWFNFMIGVKLYPLLVFFLLYLFLHIVQYT